MHFSRTHSESHMANQNKNGILDNLYKRKWSSKTMMVKLELPYEGALDMTLIKFVLLLFVTEICICFCRKHSNINIFKKEKQL